MRIGILTHNYPRTSDDRKDAGIFVYDFAQELSKEGEVFVLCPNFAGKKEEYKKVPVTWFDWMGGNEKLGSWKTFDPLSLIKFISLILEGRRAALKFAKENKLDFLLACWAIPSGVYGEYVKRHTGIPYSTWSLGSDLNVYVKYPILSNLIKNSLRNADVRFANSYLLLDKIKKIVGLDAQFLPAITHFDVKGVKPTKLDEKKFNFLFVGRLEKVKGPDILIKACNRLNKQGVNFSLKIVGEGNMREKIRAMIVDFGLERKVKLLGRLGKTEVASLMLGSDCLVIPSRNESLPLVLIEAARAGLPVVATDAGDCRRLIEDYNIGFVAGVQDEELADFMKAAANEGKQFKERRKEGLKKISERLSQENAVNILLEAIKKR